MKLRNKRILMLLLVAAALFLISGCTAPTDEAGKIVMIKFKIDNDEENN